MAPKSVSSNDGITVRSSRARTIVEDVMRRREAGEAISDAELIAAHSDLMPQLGDQLRRLAMIRRARHQAEDTQDQSLSDGPEEQTLILPVKTAPEPLPGYEILGEIYTGGQGVVYKAIQKATKRTVAVKMLPHGPHASSRERYYFEREVELAASLQHRNIITVYESGVAQGRYYFAMEYVEGQPLDRYVRTNNLAPHEIMILFGKVCDAVAWAHQHRVMHRDLKPNNILVDAEGEPHVLDFGLAKYTDPAGGPPAVHTQVSMPGQIIGTLAYMSPEQAAGRPDELDVRTDVYSLGVILYQLLTDRFPYDVQGTTLTVLRTIQEAEPTRPSKKVHMNSELEAIVLKALAKRPADRYQSAAELHYDVDSWLKGLPVMARSSSSFYVLRKLIVRHRYTSSVIGLVAVIILSFGYISFDLYLEARKAQRETAKSAQASLASRKELTETSDVLTDRWKTVQRQNTMVWILLAWNQGRTSEVEATARVLPLDSKETAAVRFLLDRRPLSEKADGFRTRLGGKDADFAEYFIGEHCLKDGNTREAVEAFRRCAQAGRREWFTAKALARLDALGGQNQPAVSQPVAQGGK